jgi:phospholipid/cholesterol/gamma-HCH transport system ATP-binding protein
VGSDTPFLEVRRVVIKSGARVLQRDLDFEVGRGQILAIVGDSGTGKRALLKSLIGLEAPAEGDVLYDGMGLWTSGEAERRRLMSRIGVSFVGGALLSTKTLLENVSMPLEAHTQLRPRDVRAVARLKLALLGLAGYENHYPAEVDEQGRVCAGIARATALDPDVLFCEKPTAGLDPRVAARVIEAIVHTRDDLGATVVIVSNDLAAVHAADEAVILGLETKTMKARGKPAYLREHADDPDVRAFLTGGLL